MQGLKEKIQNAPKQPGCYLFKDKMGYVIYVGKSKKIHSRVRQYFYKKAREDDKLKYLVREIADVEFRVTPTERDALMLEYRLIKEYKPWFNRQLKQDKRHPFIHIDTDKEYATLTITSEDEKTEKTGKEKSSRIGSFYDEEEARRALDLLNKVWKTPVCAKEDAKRACLYYHMGACLAPCEKKVPKEEYRKTIEEILLFFENKEVPAFARLHREMLACAQREDFEKAQANKILLQDLRRLQRQGKRLYHYPENRDMLVFLRAYREAGFSLFYVSGGLVYRRADFAKGQAQLALGQTKPVADEKIPAAEGAWMAPCLLEIYADKLFIEIDPRESCQKAVQEGCALFTRA